MKLFYSLWLLLSSAFVHAQYKVVITITSLPSNRPTERVYLAGSFNQWNPASEDFRMQINSQDRYAILINDLPADEYEFKFTQGSWNKVETTNDGKPIANRRIRIMSDTVLNLAIEGWADGKPTERKHTSNAQVKIMDSSFHIPQLGRNRRIWIYVPKEYYENPKLRFPVLYMHDGQNLFNEATSYAGEWGVDESMDSLRKKSIIVGIDNGQQMRMNEYNPYDHPKYGKGEGKKYVEFIAKTLKPYIDKNYRTKKDVANTMISGSSMGGLISLYAVIKYPQVFGKAGVFSPAFWVANSLRTDIATLVKPSTHKHLRIYFYAGEMENKDMVKDMLYYFERMRKLGGSKMLVRINADGKHDEPTWRAEFPAFYNWINQ